MESSQVLVVVIPNCIGTEIQKTKNAILPSILAGFTGQVDSATVGIDTYL
jgi:hypothetical protein